MNIQLSITQMTVINKITNRPRHNVVKLTVGTKPTSELPSPKKCIYLINPQVIFLVGSTETLWLDPPFCANDKL